MVFSGCSARGGIIGSPASARRTSSETHKSPDSRAYRIIGSNNEAYNLPAEDVRPVISSKSCEDAPGWGGRRYERPRQCYTILRNTCRPLKHTEHLCRWREAPEIRQLLNDYNEALLTTCGTRHIRKYWLLHKYPQCSQLFLG